MGVTVPLQRHRKEGHPITAGTIFCLKRSFILVPTQERTGSTFAVSSRDRLSITPTQPSPIEGEGFRMFGVLRV